MVAMDLHDVELDQTDELLLRQGVGLAEGGELQGKIRSGSGHGVRRRAEKVDSEGQASGQAKSNIRARVRDT